jgi:hypothetical protein
MIAPWVEAAPILSLVLLPLFIAFLPKIMSVTQSSKAIASIDMFDKKLNTILDRVKDLPIKFAIFVDDLDRTTPKMARNVLDNLRTFFDKKDLTFVVTGDHTVLERYLGRQMLPRAENESEQLEEGRRFLKKIFNVYWRIPLPIDKEIQKFLRELFKEKSVELKKIFKKEKEKEQFSSLLTRYFGKNFRLIIRFLDMTIFTFQVIKFRTVDADSKNKKYYRDLLDNPMLVLRVLMIQELCTPLFEKILEDYQILFELESSVEKKNTERIEKILEPYSKILSPSQSFFIRKFLFEKPRFFKNSSLTVRAIQPFLYLAADAKFGDFRGPLAEDFVSVVELGDPKQVKNNILNSGDDTLREIAKGAVSLLQKTTDNSIKSNHLKTLLSSLLEIPLDHSSHAIFAGEFNNIDMSYLGGAPMQDRMGVYESFWKWLDLQKEERLTKEYKEKFQFSSPGDFDFLLGEKEFGKFSSLVISSWLVAYYSQNKVGALDKMEQILGRLDKNEVMKELSTLGSTLVEDLVTDTDTQLKNRKLAIISSHVKDGNSVIRKKLFEKIKELREDVWQWSYVKTSDKDALWTMKELEQQVIDKLNEDLDDASFLALLRFSSGKVLKLLAAFWGLVLRNHFKKFFEILPQIIDDAFYEPLAPSNSVAKRLFGRLAIKVQATKEDKKLQRFVHFHKSKWLWKNLEKVPNKRIFEKLTASVGEPGEEIADSWKLSVTNLD